MAARNKKKTRTNTRKKVKKSIRYFDYSLLAVLIFLICFGLVMLYSTSSYSAQVKFNDGMFFFKKQAIISAASLVWMWFVSRINYHRYVKIAKYLFYFAMFLMSLVYFTPLGIDTYGARRWLRLPFRQQMQPSEVMKIAIILFIPVILCKIGTKVKTMKELAPALIWGAIGALGVYILTDNLSTGIIVMGIVCVMVFVMHPKTAPFMVAITAGVALIGIGTRVLGSIMTTSESFRLRRVLVWLNPEQYAGEGGFQVMQALYAIGSGGFFGKGLGNSAQKLIIPEAQNDMILSIICEELGIFGFIVILGLFGFMLYRLMFIAQNAPDLYGSLIVTGIFAHIAIQVIFNVCVVLNVIPTTGVTLPFVSYGGTSILFLMTEMGIALGVSRTIKFEE